MLKKTITYKDFNGNDRTEDFYFNISEEELIKQEMMSMKLDDEGKPIGETFADTLKAITESRDGAQIIPQFEKIVRWAYGEKSEDGRKFRKSDALADDFIDSAAYHALFREFISDANAASAFVNGIVPQNYEDGRAGTSASDLARQRSEAQLQGFKKPQERDIPTVDENNTQIFKEPDLLASERAELEELRALKAAQHQSTPPVSADPFDENPQAHRESYVERPPHESGPGYQQP